MYTTNNNNSKGTGFIISEVNEHEVNGLAKWHNENIQKNPIEASYYIDKETHNVLRFDLSLN